MISTVEKLLHYVKDELSIAIQRHLGMCPKELESENYCILTLYCLAHTLSESYLIGSSSCHLDIRMNLYFTLLQQLALDLGRKRAKVRLHESLCCMVMSTSVCRSSS